MNDRRLYFLVFGLWFAGCASSATTGESLDSDAQAASMSNTLPDAAARTPEGAIGAEIVEGKEDAGPGSEVETGSLSVSILSPESGAKVALGEVVSFSATFSTSSDDASGLTYRWESDQDGLLAEGEASTTSLSLEYQDLSAGLHTVSLTLTDALGDQGSDSLTLSVNRPPEGASTVSIAPQTPVTTDALIATIDEAALDPEGDPVTYTFTWTVDNTPSGISGDTVPAQETTQGQQWRVTAVPSDGHLSGPPAEASVTIGNSLPTVDSVTVLPSAGYTDTTFSCEAQGWNDADGASEALSFTWLVNGDAIDEVTENNLSGEHVVKGDEVQCAVTPLDGEEAGEVTLSDVVPVLDSPPLLTGVSLTPNAGNKGTLFSCVPGATSDADGDEITLQTVWLLNANELPGTTSMSSESIALSKGDTLGCKVTPVADNVAGLPVLSEVVSIGNAPPVAGGVIMTPNPATELTEIACVVADSEDPDGDNLALSFIWTVNGEVVEGQSGETLSSEHFDKGDAVLCEAVAFDGESESAPEASKVTVSVVNSPPSVAGASISPEQGSVQTTFTCAPGATSDPDPQDEVSTSVLWFHEGQEVQGGIFETLVPAAQGLGPGTLTCTVTPSDAEDPGEPVTSQPATIVNHPPSITEVTLGPQPASSSDTLECTPLGWSDQDGDLESYFYEWSVAGITLAGEHEPTLSPDKFAKGDLVVCVVTPTDGLVIGTPLPSNSLVIANSPPSLSGALITPTVGGKMTAFECEPQGATDPDPSDLNNLVFAYTWSLDEVLIVGAESKTYTPGAGIEADASLTCTVRPYDLQHYGEAVTSGPALITNLAPSVQSAIITLGDGGLYCVPQGAEDADGDSVDFLYAWLLNGSLVSGADEAFLESGELVKDDEVRCVVTPTDGSADGQPVQSAPYLFNNDGPSTPTVSLGPEGAAPGVPLECEAEANDPDGDLLTYTYVWALEGEIVPAYTQATLPAGVTEACETWSCTATASDGEAESPAGSDTMQVGAGAGESGEGYVWYGEHSAPDDAQGGDVSSKNTFFSTERVATRITPDPGVFPLTVTHVRFYGTSGTYVIEVFTDGAEPMVSLGVTEHTVQSGGMQVMTLETPIHLNGAMSLWVAINGKADYWVASGDTDGQQTDNLIYGCPTFIPSLGCIDLLGGGGEVPFEWYPFSTFDGLFDNSWSTWGDPIIDVGHLSDGEAPTCD